ncbi:hypothetical protein [Bradyrhizobium betae]|uniref:Histidine kinase n=1 Tax=Bradyrhizobium betae TaxID=244734 RepID=A0A5P6NZ52_9BRAD|nr:hypothetical protein [Bradyrhizobium betae]MCS3725333.1 hypothetical protein [Bradyrhizobium betae]QFI71351.1 hypothetical protein F8237_02575 [Bradyrhizobium betae]
MTQSSAGSGLDYSALSPITSVQEQINLLLLETLQQLADAGEPDAACRIAGKACKILRSTAPKDERRFNALLHRLVRRL